MKKIIVGLLLIAASEANAGGIIGSWGGSLNVSDVVVEFIRVKNSESFAAPRGALMRADTSAVDSVDPKGVAVKQAVTAADGRQILCVTDHAISSGDYGRCQVYGFHPAVNVRGDVSNVLKGGPLSMSQSISGTADGNTTNMRIGFALEASTTSNTVPAFLQLR